MSLLHPLFPRPKYFVPIYTAYASACAYTAYASAMITEMEPAFLVIFQSLCSLEEEISEMS